MEKSSKTISETAALEALLFVAGDPISKERIAELMDTGIVEVSNLLRQLDKELKDRGIVLRETAAGWQLSTRPEYFDIVDKLSSTVNQKLSAAMMETLSIIAFMQPVTRVEIEEIRGVNIDKAIAKLTELDLIEEVGRKPVMGRPILYGTTESFLQAFGIKSLKELPKISN
ncbi:MAG: SMC-Scp complex subunit ScpB [Selenomonadaceae bacterium]|nr:SMC-Scp complex subunit ScpB [Selenomonadaceae bacterium]